MSEPLKDAVARAEYWEQRYYQLVSNLERRSVVEPMSAVCNCTNSHYIIKAYNELQKKCTYLHDMIEELKRSEP